VTSARRRTSKSSSAAVPVEAHRLLLSRYGPLGWWPAKTPLEVCVGAVLTQNTAWSNVERALANLRAAGVLDDARAMLALPAARLEALLRPAGFFRVKARRLRALLEWIVDRGDGDAAAALRGDPVALRAELLAVHGVGRETADSLLLYAAGHPIFVVDAYTRRVAGRHGWRDPAEDYDRMREWFEAGLPRDARVYNELHAEVVIVGKEHCRPAPRCDGCPLEPLLPRGGPRLLPGEDATSRAAPRAGSARTRAGARAPARSRAR